VIDALNVRCFADSNLHGAFSVEEIAEAKGTALAVFALAELPRSAARRP
jgi:hypothetical protein